MRKRHIDGVMIENSTRNVAGTVVVQPLRNGCATLKCYQGNVRFPDINTVNEITLIHATTFEFHFALFLIPLLWFGILSLCKLQLSVK